MKRIFILIAVMVAASFTAFAAIPQILVQKGNNVKVYEATAANLTTAISAAAAGSDIYLPGGVTFAATYTINKKLNIYGAGTYTAGTTVTGISSIEQIMFDAGSDSSNVEGIKSFCNISPYWTSGMVSNITFRKCYFTEMLLATDYRASTNNINFKDCIFTNDVGYTAWISSTNKLVNFYNCIFVAMSNYSYATMLHSYNAKYYNCVFHLIPSSSYLFGYGGGQNNYFENCIFRNGTQIYSLGRLNMFVNCLTTAPQPSWGSENVADKCLINQNKDSIFTSIVTSDNTFSQSNDYHLKSTCAGKNYGTDGTDVGIYGTSSPYKDLAIPIIPLITGYNTAIKTVEGKLEISVDVKSQTK
jgi:hypothetical protein